MDFGTVVTAMVTPFDRELRIDWAATARLIDYLIEEQASDGLVISGTTGESPTLSDEEKLELFDFAVRQAKGRCKIIAGTGSNNTHHTVQLSQQAERAGVDALLLVAPYYNRPDQEGLYRHFKAVAAAVDLPVMLYNVPKRSGINIDAETTVRLAGIDNIVAIKECGSLDQIAAVFDKAPAGFSIYSGDDGMTLPILAAGGCGVVSVASHVIGKEMQAMVKSYLDGRVREAARLHAQYLPIFNGLFMSPSPGPVKVALQLYGLDTGGVRLPLTMPDEEKQRLIRALFPERAL